MFFICAIWGVNFRYFFAVFRSDKITVIISVIVKVILFVMLWVFNFLRCSPNCNGWRAQVIFMH